MLTIVNSTARFNLNLEWTVRGGDREWWEDAIIYIALLPSPSFWLSLTPLVQISLSSHLLPKKIKDRSYNFHPENTEHSLTKIRPALQARTMRKIPYQSKRTGPNREKKKYKMWKNYLPEHVIKIVNSWPYWFNGLNSIRTGLDAAQLTPSRDNREKGLESGGFCGSISFASEVSGFLWQFSNFYYWTNADGL